MSYRTRIALAVLLFLLITCTPSILAAPPAITYDSAAKTFRLDAASVSYVFGINERNELQSLYWGNRLAPSDRVPAAHILPERASFDLSQTTTPQEFAGWGSQLYDEQAAAASWNLPHGTDYTMHYLTGRWGSEFHYNSRPVQPGKTVLESRRGSTGHQNNPWFAISQGTVTEQSGDVWFGALAWSGSWSITLEQDQLQQIRVTGGFNPFDFAYPLAPGQKLETPVFYGGYTNEGMGEASRIFHRFQLANILPRPSGQPLPRPRPVLYNSWEATEFNVDEPGQTALAEKAASIGVERFVMDDGWFGQRKDDHAGLGDWYVNPQKFPNGQ